MLVCLLNTWETLYKVIIVLFSHDGTYCVILIYFLLLA